MTALIIREHIVMISFNNLQMEFVHDDLTKLKSNHFLLYFYYNSI